MAAATPKLPGSGVAGHPRLEEIAVAAGVSPATVSRVRNNPEKVSPKTRSRVLEKIRELGYGAPVEVIGLIVPDSSNAFFSQLIFLFERELSRFGYQLVSASSEGKLDREVELVEHFRGMGAKGIIYTPTRSSGEAILQLVARRDIPVVMFDRQALVGNLDCVTTTSRKATQMLVDYLFNLGHRHFGYIAGPLDTTTADDRLESFRRALSKNHLTLASDSLWIGDYRPSSGRDAAESYLALPDAARPSAVCAGNDLMAIGFMQRVMQSGVRVPADVSVAGYDGIEDGAWYFPALTTIRQPVPRLVHEAASLLLKRIEAAARGEEREQSQVSIEPELIFRDSVGPVRQHPDGRPQLVAVDSPLDPS